MEDFVKFAISKAVRKYGFSAHSPLPFSTFWNMELDDMPEYIAEFHRLKAKYSSQIDLYIGLEADYIHNYFELKHTLYSYAEFDYIIGSIHYMDPLPKGGFWCIDGSFTDFYAGLKLLFDAPQYRNRLSESYFPTYQKSVPLPDEFRHQKELLTLHRNR
jgi:histidinol-phosphatase (PHP family)